MLICCLKEIPPIESSIWDKVLPTIISTTIVIILFIIGRLLDSILKSNEIRRNWYQKVIIDPNIAKLNAFYDDSIKQTKLSIESLVQRKKELSFDDYISAKAIEINKIKEIKRVFEYEFIQLVQTNFPEIAEELYEHLRDFEDSLSQYLDKQDLSNDHFVQAEKECVSKKHCIYGILYKPLKFKRPSLRRFFKQHYTN
jgi:hypothetical protein